MSISDHWVKHEFVDLLKYIPFGPDNWIQFKEFSQISGISRALTTYYMKKWESELKIRILKDRNSKFAQRIGEKDG